MQRDTDEEINILENNIIFQYTKKSQKIVKKITLVGGLFILLVVFFLQFFVGEIKGPLAGIMIINLFKLFGLIIGTAWLLGGLSGGLLSNQIIVKNERNNIRITFKLKEKVISDLTIKRPAKIYYYNSISNLYDKTLLILEIKGENQQGNLYWSELQVNTDIYEVTLEKAKEIAQALNLELVNGGAKYIYRPSSGS